MTPRKIDWLSTSTLYRRIPLSLRTHYDSLRENGWRFYVTDTRNGYTYGESKVITIPLILLHGNPDKLSWIIAHEITHALVGVEHQHNEIFMAKLLEICPAHLLRYEEEYKPRNLERARKIQQTNWALQC